MSKDGDDPQGRLASTITGEDPGSQANESSSSTPASQKVSSNLGVDGVQGEPLDAVVGGSRPGHHPAELEEDVGRHGVDPHHEGGEGVEGEVAHEDASRGASH